MDTNYANKQDNKKIQERPVEKNLSIQEEGQAYSLGDDWVNVDSVWSTANHVRNVRVSESITADSSEAQKIMKDVVLYTPITLTKDDLNYYYESDEERDKAKVEDLKTYDWDTLTDWALSNARMRGAEAQFVKLVENLLNIRSLSEDILTGSSIEAVKACQEQFNIFADSLETDIDTYFKSHNKLVVFSEKGRLRLELCRVLKSKIAEGELSRLKSEVEADAASRIKRVKFENKYDHELSEKFDESSEKWSEEFLKYYDSETENLYEHRNIEGVSEFEKLVANETVMQRGQMQIFFKTKYNSSDAEKWNTKVIDMMRAYANGVKYSDDSKKTTPDDMLDDIIKEMAKEICEYKVTPDMIETGYAINHPKEFYDLDRLTRIALDISPTFKALITESLTRVKNKHENLMKQYDERATFLVQLCRVQKLDLDYFHGIQAGKLKEHIKDFNESSLSNQKEIDNLNEDFQVVRSRFSQIYN